MQLGPDSKLIDSLMGEVVTSGLMAPLIFCISVISSLKSLNFLGLEKLQYLSESSSTRSTKTILLSDLGDLDISISSFLRSSGDAVVPGSLTKQKLNFLRIYCLFVI